MVLPVCHPKSMVMVKWPSIWNAADLKKKDLEQRSWHNSRPFSSRPGSSGSWLYRGSEPECNPKGAPHVVKSCGAAA
jgi:hypothetical protein